MPRAAAAAWLTAGCRSPRVARPSPLHRHPAALVRAASTAAFSPLPSSSQVDTVLTAGQGGAGAAAGPALLASEAVRSQYHRLSGQGACQAGAGANGGRRPVDGAPAHCWLRAGSGRGGAVYSSVPRLRAGSGRGAAVLFCAPAGGGRRRAARPRVRPLPACRRLPHLPGRHVLHSHRARRQGGQRGTWHATWWSHPAWPAAAARASSRPGSPARSCRSPFAPSAATIYTGRAWNTGAATAARTASRSPARCAAQRGATPLAAPVARRRPQGSST